MQLEIEKELRSRFEMREESERRERIAACAQLMATQTECDNRVRNLSEKMDLEVEKLKSDISSKSIEISEKVEENCKLTDLITNLEAQIKHIQQVTVSAEANKDLIEQITRITGENEAFKRRLREAAEHVEASGSVNANRIKELEEQIRVGDTQRRKMHNLIQELRGNVRVFARVRPFLPNDGVDLQSSPEPTIAINPDGVGLKISKCANGSERAENHGFNFDKVFGPSSSQVSLEEKKTIYHYSIEFFNNNFLFFSFFLNLF